MAWRLGADLEIRVMKGKDGQKRRQEEGDRENERRREREKWKMVGVSLAPVVFSGVEL